MPDDPEGYGRIVRKNKQVRAIVEEKDASAAQRKIREVNTGMMALPTARLAGWLYKIKPRNAQKEYYLTDIVRLALADGVTVSGLPVADEWETRGVNSKGQLAQLERYVQQQEANCLLEQGVTLADAERSGSGRNRLATPSACFSCRPSKNAPTASRSAAPSRRSFSSLRNSEPPDRPFV